MMKIVLLLPIIASCFVNVSCVTLKLELGWSHQKDTEKADQATPEILDKQKLNRFEQQVGNRKRGDYSPQLWLPLAFVCALCLSSA